VPDEVYAEREAEARQRLRRRDESDWPYLALALHWAAPSGPRTRTSSAAACPPGRRTAWRSIWRRTG